MSLDVFIRRILLPRKCTRDLKPKELAQVLLWPQLTAPAPQLGLLSLAAAWTGVEAAPETQNEVFVWSLPPRSIGPISLSHHLIEFWLAGSWPASLRILCLH